MNRTEGFKRGVVDERILAVAAADAFSDATQMLAAVDATFFVVACSAREDNSHADSACQSKPPGALLLMASPVSSVFFGLISTERRLDHAGMAVGYHIPVPPSRGRHENPVLGRVYLRWAFKGWDATRKGRLFLPGRELVRARLFCRWTSE